MIKLRVAGENYFHNRDSVFAWKADTAGRKDLFAAHTSYDNTSLTRICDVCLTFDHWLKVIMDPPARGSWNKNMDTAIWFLFVCQYQVQCHCCHWNIIMSPHSLTISCGSFLLLWNNHWHTKTTDIQIQISCDSPDRHRLFWLFNPVINSIQSKMAIFEYTFFLFTNWSFMTL